MKQNEINDRKETDELTPEEAKAMWEKISSQIQVKEKQKKIKLLGAVASMVVVLCLVGIVSYERYIRPDVYMAQSSPLDMTLKDGTVIRLLESGKLTVEKSFPSETREVHLEGNAVFRVAKSKEHPFIVHGEGYDTRVLGTLFKVAQNKEAFKVELYEGKVTVMKKNHGGETYTLSPSEAFNNYGTKNIATITPLKQKEDSNTKQYVSKLPKLVSLQFKDCHLRDAIAVIEQVYDIKVGYPEEYRNRLITIRLINMSADTVLQSIALSMQLQLQQDGTTYQLEK